MNRKTNIFYNLDDIDNKFLTFSNYTEYLTGNFLSVNTKLFPSSFVCVNIPGENIEDFKKDLIYYYENKLATIRDKNVSNNTFNKYNIWSLGYLIDLIIYYNGTIQYIGDISEEDYNGTYTDIICTIQQIGQFYTYNVEYSADDTINSVKINDILYGWDSYTSGNRTDIDGIKLNLNNIDKNKEFLLNDQIIEWGNSPYYNENSLCKKIKINKNETIDQIEFNCVIPLFDVINMNLNSEYQGEILTTDDDIILFDSSTNIIEQLENRNIPLGIWINDEYVTLKVDSNTNYVPSWSLMISTQFKPFPYSKRINETLNYKQQHEFNTFASILTEQAKITELIYDLSNQIKDIYNKISTLENSIKNNPNYEGSFNTIKFEMTELEKNVDNKLENIKNELDKKYESLNWKVSI